MRKLIIDGKACIVDEVLINGEWTTYFIDGFRSAHTLPSSFTSGEKGTIKTGGHTYKWNA